MTGKWKLFKSDILCIALPAVFIANWAIHPVWTQVSFCNLDAETPVLRPTAEVCLSLYTETPTTLRVVVRFSHWSHQPLVSVSSNSLQTALAPPCRFDAVKKPNHGFHKLHQLYRVILCHCCFSFWQSTSAGIFPCTAQLVTRSFFPRKKFHTLKGSALTSIFSF